MWEAKYRPGATGVWDERLQGRERRVGGRAHRRVIFDLHAKLPIASGSVPLTTGPTVRQSR